MIDPKISTTNHLPKVKIETGESNMIPWQDDKVRASDMWRKSLNFQMDGRCIPVLKVFSHINVVSQGRMDKDFAIQMSVDSSLT